MSFEEKQQLIGKPVTANSQPVTAFQEYETDGDFITYTVRPGDTIWDIVKLYDNVTATQVMSLNNISDPEKIKVGQKLKIRKKG
jgi:LysM repeat protein